MDIKAAQHTIVRLLANREHSVGELQQKLKQRGCNQVIAQQALTWAETHGLQSDERYTEIFIRQRAAKRYGALRIKAELQAKKVDQMVISEQLRASNIDWVSYVAEALSRRNDDLTDYHGLAKANQAMLRRGYTREDIQHAIDLIKEPLA